VSRAFGPGVSIEDDMAVLVRRASGATLTYHLTAYVPWEGCRIAFNGSRATRQPGDAAGRTELWPRRFWEEPRKLEVSSGQGGRGGGDVRLLAALFGEQASDPLGEADAGDGARSPVTGPTVNHSFATGLPVTARDCWTGAPFACPPLPLSSSRRNRNSSRTPGVPTW
jgi:hypothetical protein